MSARPITMSRSPPRALDHNQFIQQVFPTQDIFRGNAMMRNDGALVKDLTLPLLLVNGYSAVFCSLALHS
jgi:hypothetical protein